MIKKKIFFFRKMFIVTEYAALSNLQDQKEYDNYFVISREAHMLAILKIKIEII